MKILHFINCWENLKTAWSGTPNGLFTALSKLVEIKEHNFHKQNGKITNAFDSFTLQMRKNHLIEKQINDSNIPDNSPIFSFGEYRTRLIEQTYCYQDLSVDYLLRLRNQKHPAAKYALPNIIPNPILKIKQRKAKRFYEGCAGVFTMSEWLRNDLIENTGIPAEKVHHVGGGCSIDVTKIDNSKKQGNRFLFVGINWDRKNGPIVVEAFRKMASKYTDIAPKLYIAGPTQKPDNIPEIDNIIFLGRLTHDELVEYYNLCDYYVMPSIFEAYGLVFAEALCFGLPCIGMNFCAMPEFIQNGENGLLINHSDVDELAMAMEKMLMNGSSMVQYVQGFRNFYLEKYSWDSVANRIVQVLRTDGFL